MCHVPLLFVLVFDAPVWVLFLVLLVLILSPEKIRTHDY
jgi:hypothetical protein